MRPLWLAILAALPLTATAAELTVSAAASLTNAFKEIAPRFEAAHPGDTVRLNFAASGTLLQQIDQGAPADVFASADQPTMDRAAQQTLIDPASRRDFVSNRLVMVEPAQGGKGLAALADLQQPGVQRIAVGKTATVPAGRYTQAVLEHAGLWSTLQPKFVQADNVRQVLDYVSRGEADAGFVYRTDAALMKDRVRVALTTQGHEPIRYPVAVVAASRQQPLAQAFIDFLVTPQARQILDKYGFGAP
ncbi:molybdate ABC transporter substrate-binding protein [Achromobacter sp. GG226]|uniref:molybdate ABC transporter substrate-binding protein n=1 Tax=Verticiella alkaliphila TaxID=2779529 RepID=UPI001C0BFF67|nr:molybdate ABC transporter substrate-binding protein [Verticiella sp. GG226]MBU4609805.1 molybdate ABC transporter substrate-binding protein [Verticiella sp. GG226]